MKSVVPLTEDELVTLQEAQKNSKKDPFRKRCLAIELSDRGKSVSYIADLYFALDGFVIRWENGLGGYKRIFFDFWTDSKHMHPKKSVYIRPIRPIRSPIVSPSYLHFPK